MTGRMRLVLAAVACLSAGPAVAQGRDWSGLDAAQTNRVAEELRGDLVGCGGVPAPYAHDCLREAARQAARRLANNAAYWEVEVALSRVSRRLDDWVRSVEDPDAARLSHGGIRLRPVIAAALPELDALTTALIDRARANILDAAPQELPFFQPIAEALQSPR